MKWYGYLGILLILLAEINFYYVIQPFADSYILIVWFGYIFFIDSLVYRIKGKSLISSYKKEFLFMVLLSAPFWLIFEFYNVFTHSWFYVNALWYQGLFAFATIIPSVMETFSLVKAFNIGTWLDAKRAAAKPKRSNALSIKLLVVFGFILAISPIILGPIGVLLMWPGLGLFFDPLNYLTGKPSLLQQASLGKKSIILQLSIAGLITGFFWEFWNYQAYPHWVYALPSLVINIKLFAMPLEGYIGYIPFGATCFLFYAFFRHKLFKNKNDLISM